MLNFKYNLQDYNFKTLVSEVWLAYPDEIIKMLEIDKSTYSRWIKGKTKPPMYALKFLDFIYQGVIPFKYWHSVRFTPFGIDLGGKCDISIKKLTNYYEHLQACDWQRTQAKMNDETIKELRLEVATLKKQKSRTVEIRLDGKVVKSLVV